MKHSINWQLQKLDQYIGSDRPCLVHAMLKHKTVHLVLMTQRTQAIKLRNSLGNPFDRCKFL